MLTDLDRVRALYDAILLISRTMPLSGFQLRPIKQEIATSEMGLPIGPFRLTKSGHSASARFMSTRPSVMGPVMSSLPE